MFFSRKIAATGGLTLIASLVSASLPSWAEEPTAILPPLIVSATQIETRAEQIGNSVTVITADDIARNQWRTLPEALATVPGVQVTQSGGPGDTAAVFIRGNNANHTKVVIDGIEANDPSTPNDAFDFGQVLISDVARIEVLRGPQSGLYGSDAIGGVILIETKKGQGDPKLTGTLEGGSFGTFNQNAGLSGSTERFNYAFNVAHFHSDDTPVTPLDLLPPGQKSIGDSYDNLTYSSRIGADLSDQFGVNLTARYTSSNLWFTGDNFNVFPPVPAAQQSNQQDRQLYTRGEARWTLFGGAFDNRFGVAYTQDHTRFFDPTQPTADAVTNEQGDRVKFDWRGKLILAPEETVLIGLEDEIEQITNSPISAQNGNKAGFAEWQGRVIDRLYASASVRVDDNDRFGTEATWRFAPTYLVAATDTQFKGSVGTGFKAPSLNQLFVSFPSFGFAANPNLKPEESFGYDLGFEQPVLHNKFRFGSTFFHNDIRNLIDDNATFTTLINIDRATTYGFENFAAWTVTSALDLRADYTYTEAKDDLTGQELIRRPKHKASLTGTWRPLEDLSLSVTGLFVGTRIDGNRDFTATGLHAAPYYLVNLAASYQINPRVALFARIDNLLNQHYEDLIGFLRPGIGAFAGITVSLDGKMVSP